MTHVVAPFLRHGSDVLLGRRGDAGGTGIDRFAGVLASVEGDPSDTERDARRAVRDETGRQDATLVRAGGPVEIEDGGRTWTVHPFLFEVDSRAAAPREGVAAREWVSPPAIRERETMPGLWAAYEAVAPTVETVRTDAGHGSAWLSLRALEILRDRAAVAEDTAAVTAVARELRDARPSMAAVANRVNRVMSGGDRTPTAVRERAERVADGALDAGREAAARAANLCGESVVTLSRSGTVRAAVERARPTVLLGESRPGREGAEVAAELADSGLDVTLTTDAALPTELATREPDAVLVGADAVLADGSVLNKVGTRAVALAAARAGVPVYVVAATAKVRPDETVHGETADATDLYDGPAPVAVANPVFDRTPADLVTGVVTERGVLDGDGVRTVVADHRANAAWDER
jgi:translation initiation factor 2B subunit (eIF-2B alpha/beta/delta family)